MEEDLPEALVEEFTSWVMEHEIAPTGFPEAVQAAVAVLLGVMPDPDEDPVALHDRLSKFSQPMSLNTLHNYVTDNGPCHVWVRKNKYGPLVPALVSNHVHGLVAIWRAGSKSDWLQEKDYGKRWTAYWQNSSSC